MYLLPTRMAEGPVSTPHSSPSLPLSPLLLTRHSLVSVDTVVRCTVAVAAVAVAAVVVVGIIVAAGTVAAAVEAAIVAAVAAVDPNPALRRSFRSRLRADRSLPFSTSFSRSLLSSSSTCSF